MPRIESRATISSLKATKTAYSMANEILHPPIPLPPPMQVPASQRLSVPRPIPAIDALPRGLQELPPILIVPYRVNVLIAIIIALSAAVVLLVLYIARTA